MSEWNQKFVHVHSAGSSRRLISRAVLAGVVAAGISVPALADATWQGTTSQDWNEGTNWSTNPPTGNFIINTATGNIPVLSTEPVFGPVDVFVGSGAGNTGQFNQSGGTLAVAVTGEAASADPGSGNWFMVGRDNGTGTYNLTGTGSLNVGKLHAGGAYYAPGGTGTININTTGTVLANSTRGFGYLFGNSAYASIVLGVGDFGANLGTGTLNLQNGTIQAAGEIHLGSHGGTGTLTQTGGTINTSGLVMARWRGAGSATVSNGTINAGFVNLTQAGIASDLVTGTLTVDNGGTVNSEGDFITAFAGSADSVGTVNVKAGGVVNVATSTERWFIVSIYDTLKGVVNVDGGTINLNANSDLRFSTGGNTGANVVNLNSGAITAWEGNLTGASTGSVVDLNQGGGENVNNTFNLNGGTLTINQIIATNAVGTRRVNFNGGVVKAAGSTDTFVAGIDNLYVQSGGAKIDTNGFDVKIATPFIDDVGVTGTLTKQGAGTLTLAGVNGYSGRTIVKAGTLKVNYSSVLATAATPILSGGGVDLEGTSTLAFDYTGDTSPVTQVKNILTAGYAGNFAAGQIRGVNLAAGRTLGYGDNGTNTVVVKVTLPGDAELDGDVDFNDFLVLQNNFAQTGTRFDQANFNYDGVTDFNDFLALQNFFGQSVNGDTVAFSDAQVAALTAFAANPLNQAVPEPASLALIGLGAAGLLRRRVNAR